MPARPRPITPPYLYPGGGRRLADLVLERVPPYFREYYEPFLGGGAVAIAVMERFAETTFHLSSDDPELVVTWEVLAAEVDALVSLVGRHRDRHDRAYFAEVRSWEAGRMAALSPTEQAARFLYLRGAADAGGTPRDTVAFDEGNVRRLSALLQNRDVRVQTRNFFSIVSEVAEEDLVYLDPPFDADPDDPAAEVTLLKETRSLVGTVTARGAYLLAPGPQNGDVPPVYAGWNTMALAADRGDGETLWSNRTLGRALRR